MRNMKWFKVRFSLEMDGKLEMGVETSNSFTEVSGFTVFMALLDFTTWSALHPSSILMDFGDRKIQNQLPI